ncbi:Putative translation Initiation factor eIF- 4e [Septoria linicola]|uniref:Translation Initiation factor eIF- 4e n=1 Tax=Septoria linicola TaxID=215465 RepID=A0A9Q9AWZ7_9PEZI|nr:putative translation Initiation factor eIF- 4e [Septoria linicola]USW56559.1 Putative translation Initiation factor eIF- 4e [Septoria linicola]
MAQQDLIDGEGWISDESSFYGDETVRAECERRARRRLERPYEPSAPIPSRKRIKSDQPDSPISPSGLPDLDSSPTKGSDRSHDVVSFLKSRPQISALRNTYTMSEPSAKTTMPHGSQHGQESCHVDVPNRRLGHDNAWQHDEAVEDFLRRMPPGDSLTHSDDGWLWVESPTLPHAQATDRQSSNIEAFRQHAAGLLSSFEAKQIATEMEYSGRASGITRKMGPLRDQLEIDLLALAITTGVTCGKWMLFPNAGDLPHFWRAVAIATAEGKLGPTSKTAIFNPKEPETVICIYTYDFSDSNDVRRVLKELVDLDLCSAHRKAIYYKIDAYTYLGINSKNDYKLRASLCSSKDVLLNNGKALTDGPVAKLKKRGQTTENFYTLFGDDL